MIRKAIEEGNVKEALGHLGNFLDFIKGLENELPQQFSRASKLDKEVRSGTITRENKSVETNKLTQSTIYLCHKIEKKLPEYFPEVKFDFTPESLDEQLKRKLYRKYDKLEKIADGDSATFFRGTDSDTKRKVIIRILNDFRAGDHKSQSSISNDQRLDRSLRIKHRNIIRVLGADFKSVPKYLELEHIDGVSLDHLIGHIPFTRARAFSVVKQLCEALYHLHTNDIVHKNVKPDKVLIDNELRPVISPFDILSSSKSSASDLVSIDKLMYAAPELLSGNKEEINFNCDQFSMGVLAFEILSGKYLFFRSKEKRKNPNIQDVMKERIKFFSVKKYRKERASETDIPNELKKVIFKMLAEKPEDRYETFEEIVRELDQIKLSCSPEAEVASSSYQRCCIANPEFTKDFYVRLFEHSTHQDEIKKFFSNEGDEKQKSRRERMLRLSIELLIENGSEPVKLKEIKKLTPHKGVGDHLYEGFIDTIIDCVAENDYVWKRYEELRTDNPIQAAWAEVKKNSLAILQK